MTLINIWENIKINLFYCGIGGVLFLLSYLSNIVLGMYYNIKIKNQKLSKKKLIQSLIKFVCVIVGVTLLCIVVTTLPMFVDYVGISIPEEYLNLFSNLIIVLAFIIATCQYVKESYEKLKNILGVVIENAENESFVCPYYQELENNVNNNILLNESEEKSLNINKSKKMNNKNEDKGVG